MRETNRAAAAANPSFALIGGDIAYASSSAPSFLPGFILELFDKAKGQNATRWMEWLIAYSQDMVTKRGILIPMIPIIGNHDVNGRFGQKPEEAPFFLFPSSPFPEGMAMAFGFRPLPLYPRSRFGTYASYRRPTNGMARRGVGR